MDAPEQDISSVVATIKELVHKKKNARGIVEEMRTLSLHPYIAELFSTLLATLQQLKADKKAGESNKAIKQAYAYLSALAVRGMLDEGELMTAMHQLTRVDMRDELVTRQLAALQLYAEFSARFPQIDMSAQFVTAIAPLLADAAASVEATTAAAMASAASGGGGGGSSAWGKKLVAAARTTNSNMTASAAPLAFAALAVVSGTLAQPHASIRKHLRVGFESRVECDRWGCEQDCSVCITAGE